MRVLLMGVAAAAILGACQAKTQTDPQIGFAVNLNTLCDQTLTGSVVSDDPQDGDWRGKVLTVGPIVCEQSGQNTVITAPLAVGADKSRIWTITSNETQVKLHHAHTLKDGTPDPVTGYGGTTVDAGKATRQDFPVDEYSIKLFQENGLEASVTNVWSLEIRPGEIFAYELNREGRHFRAEFPLK